MAFQRIVPVRLPDGRTEKLYPFHLSLEGLENNLLCRDQEDYAVVDRFIFVSAWVCGVRVVIEVVMSNHGHVCLLAPGLDQVRDMADALKQRCSMYIADKYGEHKVLRDTWADIQLLDSDWYVRNVLAYIPRNIVDTGVRIEDYPWCGYNGMFVGGSRVGSVRAVSALSRREKETLFHTHANLSDVPWMLDKDDRLVHATCCDWQYLESAFNNDQAFFLKSIGSVNLAEMEQKLVLNQRSMRPDSSFLLTVEDLSGRWFQKKPYELTPEQRTRLVPYLYRCYRTSVPQLSRCMRMNRAEVEGILRRSR